MFDVMFLFLLLPFIGTVAILTSHLLDEIPALNGAAHSSWEFH